MKNEMINTGLSFFLLVFAFCLSSCDSNEGQPNLTDTNVSIDTTVIFDTDLGTEITRIEKRFLDDVVSIELDTTEVIDPVTYKSKIRYNERKIYRTELISETKIKLDAVEVFDTIVIIDPKTYKSSTQVVRSIKFADPPK